MHASPICNMINKLVSIYGGPRGREAHILRFLTPPSPSTSRRRYSIMSTPSQPPATPNDTQSNDRQSDDTQSDSNVTQAFGPEIILEELATHIIRRAKYFIRNEYLWEEKRGAQPARDLWDGAREIVEGAQQKANVRACLEPSEQTGFSTSCFGCAN
jgi:hypothetical protein